MHLVASLDEPVVYSFDLVAKVDAAMYQSKSAHTGRPVVYQG